MKMYSPLPSTRILSLVLLSFIFFIGCKKNDPAPPIPVISSFSPSTDTIGSQVIIIGNNFSATAAGNLVKFNGVMAVVTAATTTQLTTTVPAGATTGPITVTVNGQTGTSASPFTVLGPSITGFLPAVGGIGYPLVIKGSHFSADPTMNAVMINGSAATVMAAADSQLTVIIPNAASSGKISLTVKGQTAVSANDIVIKKLIVTTIAGTGSAGSADGPGNTASFNGLWGVVADNSGNLYISDSYNFVIRKITPGGIVSTFAGSAGKQGSADGPVNTARFVDPFGLALDKTGNMYVCDLGMNCVRKIDPNGIVTTIAGNLSWKTGSADGTGSAASFSTPLGLAVDVNNNLFVADGSNNKIRKISPAGVVTTFAGSGVAGSADGQGTAASFKTPGMIVLDSAGNLYVTDYGNNKIRKITPTGNVTTLAGSGAAGYADGQGAAASFYLPIGITIDATGNLYVTDQPNQRIRMITPGGWVTTLAGNGNKTSVDNIGNAASFADPVGITIDKNGVMYVLDNFTDKVRKVVIQ